MKEVYRKFFSCYSVSLMLSLRPNRKLTPINQNFHKKMAATEEKTRYSAEELAEFEQIILKKLAATNNELNFIKETLSRKNDNGTDYTAGSTKMLEDGADVSEKEQLSQSAARLQKFASQLEAALIRIKNGTYGICKDSGKLISKERLRAVPHTQQTIEAKLKAS